MKKGVISSLYPTTKALIIFLGLFLSFFFDWRFAYFFVLPFCIFLALIDGGRNYTFGSAGSTISSGNSPSAPANPDLKWLDQLYGCHQ